jgi:putative aldouronate transport system substrate-binding protein
LGKLKSIIAMLLVMLLALSLITACGQKPSEEADKQPDQEVEVEDKDKEDDKEDAPEPEDDVEIDTSKFVEVVWYHLGDPPTNEQLNLAAEEWNKILEEKVNAHLKINFIEWADYLTKYNLMLASREVLDMINTASDWLDMWPNAAKGAFMDITDLLPKYAPQTWSEVPEEHWDQCKFDGKIITIPEDQYTQWVNHGFYYRGDWAEEFGITEPIRHWDTLGEYLQKVKDIKGVIPYDVAGSKANEILDYWMAAKNVSDTKSSERIGSWVRLTRYMYTSCLYLAYISFIWDITFSFHNISVNFISFVTLILEYLKATCKVQAAYFHKTYNIPVI